MSSETLCVRRTDGAIFRAFCPDDYSRATALAAILSGARKFYFRRVSFDPGPWWSKGKYIETGEIWEPSRDEFDVVDA